MGEIVGSYSTHGFLDVNGVFTTIDVPFGVNTIPKGINDSGEIVGIYTPASTPEPASLLLLASGLAGIIILIVRRRMTKTSTY
jgi:hypothetical protein